jgi:toxin ParE1/3/4
MKRLIVSKQAEHDTFEIWTYIAADREDAADRVVSKLYAAFEALSRMPGMGVRRPEFRGVGLRFFLVAVYVVAYREMPETVEILAVIDGRRDVPAILESRKP